MSHLTATAYTREYYDQHKADGMDYLGHGAWQTEYGQWLSESLGVPGEALDVGCACGSVAAGLSHAGWITTGIDLCEYMIARGREAFPDIRLEICDAANLHLFGAGQFAFIHSAQAAEHFRPAAVPLILSELYRVAASGALFFCALDTQELYDRQRRDPATEDKTHICIRPMHWWTAKLADAGWEIVTALYRDRLASHPQNYIAGGRASYDWDWFIGRKP